MSKILKFTPKVSKKQVVQTKVIGRIKRDVQLSFPPAVVSDVSGNLNDQRVRLKAFADAVEKFIDQKCADVNEREVSLIYRGFKCFTLEELAHKLFDSGQDEWAGVKAPYYLALARRIKTMLEPPTTLP